MRLLLILLCLTGAFCIILIFGLMGAAKKADEGEDKILEIISQAPIASNKKILS